LHEATSAYEVKRKQRNVAESSLFALAWEISAYETLIKTNADIHSRCNKLLASINGPVRNRGKLADSFSVLRKDLKSYTKDVYSKFREAATHIMIFMIAGERRDTKPYAIPVRVLPYHSVTDAKVRELRDELRQVMKSLGMVVVGMLFVSFLMYFKLS
jgi:hypothetical protein